MKTKRFDKYDEIDFKGYIQYGIVKKPVHFEITEQTRDSVVNLINKNGE